VLAERAAHHTARKDPVTLATLAAAYAEAGRFDAAVEMEQRAIDRATEEGHASLAASIRTRLAPLGARLPIRQRSW